MQFKKLLATIPMINRASTTDTIDDAIYSYLVFKINKIIPHNNLEVSKLPLRDRDVYRKEESIDY